jgi:hypothetical protein
MPLICVHVKEPTLKQAVIDEIRRLDASAELDDYENSELNDKAVQTAFWIDTEIPYWEVEQLTGVADAIREGDVCSCGSGERKDELLDARGIYCCSYCSSCEVEKRAQYRTEVLEDSCYEVDEQIEAEYEDDLK